jgi:hypothetical protein
MQRANGKRSEQTCRTRHGTAHRGRGAYRLKPSALRGKIAVVAAWRGSPTGSDGRSTKQNHVMLNFFYFLSYFASRRDPPCPPELRVPASRALNRWESHCMAQYQRVLWLLIDVNTLFNVCLTK